MFNCTVDYRVLFHSKIVPFCVPSVRMREVRVLWTFTIPSLLFFFFYLDILLRVYWEITAVFICIHPVTDDFVHSSYAFLPSAHLLWQSLCLGSLLILGGGLFISLLLSFVFFILNTSPLWERWFEKLSYGLFFPSTGNVLHIGKTLKYI